jgi:putative secretion ATPase (PEP-CTERM system associated)
MRVLAYLEYGVYHAEGFIVVTGEVGAGKTTLIRKLFGDLDPAKVVGAQLVSTQLDGEDTLRMVMAAFGLHATSKSKAVLLMRLEEFLKVCHEQGKRVLLVVDEAQNLNHSALEELRMLSNFQATERSLIQTFLVGQPEFRATMNSSRMTQLRQRVIAACHLPALDASDTRAYIEHRLQTVGWKADPWFDEEAFQEIHKFTGGVPRRINTLCDRLMLMGFIDGKHAFGGAEVREVIMEIQSEMPGSSRRGKRAAADSLPGPAPSVDPGLGDGILSDGQKQEYREPTET